MSSTASGHSKGEGREAKGSLPPWPQHRRCGGTQSSSLPNVDASTQEGCSGGTSPHLTPLAISQAWKCQLFCWRRNKISVQSHPVAATVSTHQPSLPRTSAQLSFGSTASGKLLPSRSSMTCNQICANSETSPSGSACRVPLSSSLLSHGPPALVPSSMFFAALSSSAHLWFHHSTLGLTKSPPTCTSFSGLLSPT